MTDREIVRLRTTASTMRDASELAAAGCAHGTAVVADEQTAGIGRQGHSWHSEPEAGLYVSVVLRLPETSPILTLALGLAAVDAIRNTAGVVCDLRWPNDVLAGGKKLAGIIVQMADSAAIAGIGINLNHTGFPAELAALATSLRLQTGRPVDREALLQNLLAAIDDGCEILRSGGNAALLKMFSTASSYVSGKRVKVDLGERTIEGVTAGLDDAGFLRVRLADGTCETILAGGVRPA
jgi:BirA family transcriptional regulator, biotin operon repressor / biotin---[acetyl-CoA-carboxylase] ligase